MASACAVATVLGLLVLSCEAACFGLFSIDKILILPRNVKKYFENVIIKGPEFILNINDK